MCALSHVPIVYTHVGERKRERAEKRASERESRAKEKNIATFAVCRLRRRLGAKDIEIFYIHTPDIERSPLYRSVSKIFCRHETKAKPQTEIRNPKKRS